MDQLIVGSCANSSFSGPATRYINLMGGRTWTTNTNVAKQLCPAAGNLSTLVVEVVTTPSSGYEFVFTIVKNGEDTDVQCTVSSGSTTAVGLETVSVAAGDNIYLKAYNSGGANALEARWSAIFSGSNNQCIYMAGSTEPLYDGVATYHNSIAMQSASWPTQAGGVRWTRNVVIPTSGTFKNLYVELADAPGTGKSRIFALTKNDGSSAGLYTTISGESTTGNNTINTISVSPHDRIMIKCNNTNTPTTTTAMWGVVFESDTNNECVFFGAAINFPSQSETEYNSLHSAYDQWDNLEDDHEQVMIAGAIIKKLHVQVYNAPEAGKSFTYTIRKNNADTNITCTISDTSTQAADTTASAEYNWFDDACIACTPSAGYPNRDYVLSSVVCTGFKILVENINADDSFALKVAALSLEDGISINDALSMDYFEVIPKTGYSVFVEGSDYFRVYNIFSVKYDEPGILLSQIPTFEIETDNITGRRLNQFSIGKGCKIYRDGVLQFYGEIEPRGFKKGTQGSTMTFGGPHQGYNHLKNRVCDYYRADNNSYAPVVNPWQFGRKTTTTNALVDGLRPDEIMECLIGTKFIWQEWFDNHDYLRWTTTQPELVVYDGVLKLPKTASTADAADSYATSGYVESIGLYNGDKNVDPMGTISTVTAKIIGTKYSSYDPVLYVCRDADESSPTWTQLVTTYDGDGVWTGDVDLSSDGASILNQFGYYLSLNSDGDGTTEIDYVRFDCVTVSDTSVAAGSIDNYNDPNTSDDTIAIDLVGLTRLEALERVRTFTNLGTVYADINWDAYVDNDLQFHFTSVRGEDIDKTFSFANKNLTLIDQHYDGEIKNALIAIGQGEEPYAVTLTGSEMQDTTSIAEYGKKTGYFIDKSIPDAPTLYKRAKAYLKYMKDPRENLDIKICNDPALNWSVGDRIKVYDTELNIDNYYRVLARQITKKQDSAEQIDIKVGTVSDTIGSVFKNIQSRFGSQEVISQGTGSPTNTLAAGLAFDTTKAAEYPFYVPKNAQRVTISVKTHQFRAYSKASAATAAGMTDAWSNPQEKTVTVPADTVDFYRIDTPIPSYSGRLFVTARELGNPGAYNSTFDICTGTASSVEDTHSHLYWSPWTSDPHFMMSIQLPVFLDEGYAGKYFWIRLWNVKSTSCQVDLSVWLYKEETHTHDLNFGIYEFGYYPAKTCMRVDSISNPVVQKFGYIGTESTSAEVIDLDITDNLRDDNGKIVTGLHTLYFHSQPSTNNTDGLGIISVQHQITVNTASNIDLSPLPE